MTLVPLLGWEFFILLLGLKWKKNMSDYKATIFLFF